MEITVQRFDYNEASTIGLFFIDGVFKCFTLEDKKRDFKVKGISCIPSGRYPIELNLVGGMNFKYEKKYQFHKGMLEIKDIPDFNFVYIHVGNFPTDTAGCLLVGKSYFANKEMIHASIKAYEEIYPLILSALQKKEKVFITIHDTLF